MIIRQVPGGITVDEACSTEFIAAELFEAANPQWLEIRDVSEGPEGMTGSFRIKAVNGEWTYRLLRRVPWLDGVFEAELALGELLLCPAMREAR